jgi:hypothetical protein
VSWEQLELEIAETFGGFGGRDRYEVAVEDWCARRVASNKTAKSDWAERAKFLRRVNPAAADEMRRKERERKRRWRLANPDSVKQQREYKRQWIESNREKDREYQRNYQREYRRKRYASDPAFRERARIAVRDCSRRKKAA